MEVYLKVKFNKEFKADWLAYVASDENMTIEEAESSYLCDKYGKSFHDLNDRVAGNVGFVKYSGNNDYFEIGDDNWCIPSECFEFLSAYECN